MHHFFERLHGRQSRRHGGYGPASLDESELFHAQAGERGFGRFGGRHGGRHGGGFDWDGPRGGGRMFGHGDLKLLLLVLIEQQPRHGYELIRMIGEMFHGQYTPSPGAVYPTLTMLEEMGYAEVESQAGNRKLYAITAEGRAWLAENREAVEAVSQRAERGARLAAKMAMPQPVHKAMHAIRAAMMMYGAAGWNRAEAQRVAEILDRAADEIVQGRPK